MKNRAIVKRYTALSALSGRALPSKAAVNKVATLLRGRFSVPHETIELARKMVIRQHPLPEGWEGERQPAAVQEARALAIDALMEESQPVKKIPDHLRLTPDDMPRALKGDEKREEPNDRGVASIIDLLGSLYVPGTEIEEDAALEESEKGAVEPDDDMGSADEARKLLEATVGDTGAEE